MIVMIRALLLEHQLNGWSIRMILLHSINMTKMALESVINFT